MRNNPHTSASYHLPSSETEQEHCMELSTVEQILRQSISSTAFSTRPIHAGSKFAFRSIEI
jgi:hypothetical protein